MEKNKEILTCISCGRHGYHALGCPCKDAPTSREKPIMYPEGLVINLEQRVKVLEEYNKFLSGVVNERDTVIFQVEAKCTELAEENKKLKADNGDLQKQNDRLFRINAKLKFGDKQ